MKRSPMLEQTRKKQWAERRAHKEASEEIKENRKRTSTPHSQTQAKQSLDDQIKSRLAKKTKQTIHFNSVSIPLISFTSPG